MARNYLARLVGVFGDPIAENPTGVMQEAAFAALGLNWRYINFHVPAERLEDAFAGLRGLGFDGINLTIPHKVDAIRHVDRLSDSARLIGAINTVVARDGVLTGTNTDGQGFVVSLRENGIGLEGKRLAVLGAGGAARAICIESALAGCASIEVINRNAVRGQALCDLVSARTPAACGFTHWTGAVRIPDCDILVNATNVGLFPNTDRPDIVYDDIRPGMIVQDIIPNPADTYFLQSAAQSGARVFDGQGMLVWQGAIAFKLWTGLDAPVDVMKAALAAELSA